MRSSKLGLPLMMFFFTMMTLLMGLFPNPMLTAALRGVSIWWDVLFPSLFPFFIISEMMLAFGIVHLIGTFMDPLMKPVFKIPGSGGFVAAMGYVSGYPIGAKLTTKLWQEKMITREEGERLVAFTTSSDPIFLIGAVAVGFFHNPGIAAILALAHYGGGLIIGILMRFHGQKASPSMHKSLQALGTGPLAAAPHRGRVAQAFSAMHEARVSSGRSLSEMLRDAVSSSLQLIIVVGGLVVFFSVFLELLVQSGVMQVLYYLLQHALHIIGFPTSLSEALVGGIFEVTLGARAAAEAGSAIPLPYKAAAAAFILSWGGLSVHAQIASILHATNLRYWPFLLARFLHGVVAVSLVLLLWKPVMGQTLSVGTFSLLTQAPVLAPLQATFLTRFALFILIIGTFMLVMLILYGIFSALQRLLRNHR